jgi:hypothetical protein
MGASVIASELRGGSHNLFQKSRPLRQRLTLWFSTSNGQLSIKTVRLKSALRIDLSSVLSVVAMLLLRGELECQEISTRLGCGLAA